MSTRHGVSPRGVHGLVCPVCGLVTQRAYGGTAQDGLAEHLRVVHQGPQDDGC